MHTTQGATKQTIDKTENHPISQLFKGSKKKGGFQKPTPHFTFQIRPPPPPRNHHLKKRTQKWGGCKWETLPTNVSMTLCDWQIRQTHVLCGCTTFGTELKLGTKLIRSLRLL